MTAPGEMIGEVGLVPGHRHSSTAVALQECQGTCVGARSSGSLDRSILRAMQNAILERRLDELETRFAVSTQMASPRLAHALLRSN